ANHGVAARPIQPIHKTIGINKLGTLLSSQTTDTFEYFGNKIRICFAFSSLRCFQLISFLFTFANPVFFRNLLGGMNLPSINSSFSPDRALLRQESLLI
ncbi:hypothetical protein, partial [Pseudarthrobacter sp. NamE2]|uniref:hypothetical protein n=1 Tax=Pseudarthrobacter sp. NamE2 TaxID=2576838 RepID=UPI00197A7AFD